MALCFKITSMRFKEREVTSGTSAVTSLAVEAPLCTLVWKCSAGHWNRIPSTPGRRAPFEPLGLRLSTLSQGRSANPRFSSGCLWGPDSLFTVSNTKASEPALVRGRFYKPPAELSGARAPQEPLRSWLRAELRGDRGLFPADVTPAIFPSCICRCRAIESTLKLSLYCFCLVTS